MQLYRVFKSAIALGVLRDDAGRIFWTTFEDRPIPAGRYIVRLMPAAANPKHGECWEIQNVPGRSDILFHVGNDASDSDGCVLVGQGFAADAAAITNSVAGYKRFRKFLSARTQFNLEVHDPT